MEVERALVEAEMESEVAGLQQEKDALEALHNKMADLETQSQQEKEKVFNCLHWWFKNKKSLEFLFHFHHKICVSTATHISLPRVCVCVLVVLKILMGVM